MESLSSSIQWAQIAYVTAAVVAPEVLICSFLMDPSIELQTQRQTYPCGYGQSRGPRPLSRSRPPNLRFAVDQMQARRATNSTFLGCCLALYHRPSMDPDNTATPETIALARQILRSISLATAGRHLATCRLKSIPGATTACTTFATTGSS